ncbi:MAG: hypothetical protein ALECFALPRED_005323 [Alectoria fallacina]|uniref:PH domain-containing protein n=1 Tax=Alectoria fallacina TaxID=1903189 RepID=A0A8H3FYQ6_9LECA|nr:MAG: hypothetical protein ALECFALPRED_005323 [Alectoria fallacina]
MEIAHDTIPELQPIFSFLNSHSNKLYQEGYFLKLNDLDSNGRPNHDRSWTESFAQLVGTILSLWDASALDAAGQDGEVAPTFINLADASIKMIETLPTRSQEVQPLQNVLSISTAGKNRYLFHFNSLHSLTQWTAAIRLAMYENSTLQEAYTGSLIAGKGKLLNNIKVIMDRTRIQNEDWTRVRFGAGTPWRRCWCVVSPPSEKDVHKQQKQLKKKSAYEHAPVLKGNIKFYDTRKTKKAQPIATINDAYSAYAIYPQSKPLIEQSTLVKIEGSITIHSTPETTTDGFVFVMPEAHPAVSGFEMMLRYLFPVYDVFALYGRPTRLIADTLDPRSLMFALPQERRYGYLEILDVAGLIHETGSQSWTERDWRKKMKDLTSQRMTRMASNGRPRSRASSYRGYRNSIASRAGTLRYEDGASIKSTPSLRNDSAPVPPQHLDRANSEPPVDQPFTPPRPRAQHQRSFSEASPQSSPPRQRSQKYIQEQNYTPSRLSHDQSRPSFEATPPRVNSYEQMAPAPPTHGVPIGMAARNPQMQRYANESGRSSSESERRFVGVNGGLNETDPQELRQEMRPAPPPSLVAAPPAFSHEPGAKPQKRPGLDAELRRANSRLSITTLSQLTDAGKAGTTGTAAAGAAAAWKSNSQRNMNGTSLEDQGPRGVNPNASNSRITADRSSPAEGLVIANTRQTPPNREGSPDTSFASSQSDTQSAPYYKDKPLMSSYDLLSPQNASSRAASPLSQPSMSSSPPSQPPNGVRTARKSSFSGQSQAVISASSSSNLTFGINKPPPLPMAPQQRPEPHRSKSSISRKPVPAKSPSPTKESIARVGSIPPSPQSSLDNLHDRYIDEDALTQVLERQRLQSLTSEKNAGSVDDASVYDNDSTVSPDYASTRRSTETKRSRPSAETPRRGVLKTVGTVEPVQQEVQVGDVHYRPGTTPEPLNSDIPTVDFGPTQAYNPRASSRPNTSGTLNQQLNDNSESRGTFIASPRNEEPAEAQPSAVVYPFGQQTESSERAPSRNMITPEPQVRSSSAADGNDNRRSVAWQPGAQIGGIPGARQSITPEQFVQQRAAANRVMTPVYAHARKGSGPSTPPAVPRNASGEWPTQHQKRQSSYSNDVPARPSSRAATAMINNPSDYTAHLSAREQEHVARVTNSPLINMAGSTNKNPPQGGGLVGAIEAREKEKREIKQGLSGQMVQQAIHQRQQHSQVQQQRQPSQQSFSTPSPQFSMPGQFPASPGQYPTPGVAQQQQYAPHQQYPQMQSQHWTPPATQQYWGQHQQSPSPFQQQHGPFPVQPIYQQQQGQYGQGQPQQYGPYFGNGQGGRQ